MLRRTAALSICLTLAACASAATTIGFPAADEDDNNVLSRGEYIEFFDDTDAFERFDDDDNRTLNRSEYNEAVDSSYETAGIFGNLDRDGNRRLRRNEFIIGWFNIFDVNNNGTLSRREFESSLAALNIEL